MRILIVEDNPTDRDLLLALLQERFMSQAKFRLASDLRGAFDYLNRRHSSIIPSAELISNEPYFHCVILDLGLPDSNGRDTFEAIHQKHPHIPIVVVSNNLDQALAIDLIRGGAEDFILKDFTNTSDLFRRVMFAIERAARNTRREIQALNDAAKSR